MTTTMQTAQISKPGGDWEVVERDIPEPDAGHVRVKVEVCGICHSDVFVKDGLWPGLQYPRVPGHEVAGRIDAVGDTVSAWRHGERVGVGWHGGHCLVCDPCRRGDFTMCVQRKVTGVDFDGGYAEYMLAPVTALAAIPEAVPAEEAGPFMCAGVTVYNALRHAGARAGEVVAVHGIGRLGHLGVQYARQMGFATVAINRGNDKEPLARQPGAHYYIDASAQDAVTALQKLGGARDSGDRAERPGDFSLGGRLVGQRHPGGGGRPGGAVDDQCNGAHQWEAIRGGLVLRHREGCARHPRIQCLDRGAPDDRNLSAPSRGGRLRAHAQRPGAVSRRAHRRWVTHHAGALPFIRP